MGTTGPVKTLYCFKASKGDLPGKDMGVGGEENYGEIALLFYITANKK